MITTWLESLVAFLVSLLSWKRGGKVLPSSAAGGFVLGSTMPFGDVGEETNPHAVVLDQDRCKHIGLWGQSGCGKSTTLLRLQDYDRAAGRTFVALSYRSDAMRRSLVRLMAAGVSADAVDIIDCGDPDFVWPLDFLGSGQGDPYVRSQITFDAMQCETVEFGVQVGQDVRLSTTACALAGFGLTEIERVLAPDGGAFRAALAAKCPGFIQDGLAAYEALAEEVKRSRCAAAANKTSPFLFSPFLQHTFGIPSCPAFASILDSPGRILLVNLAEDKQPASGLLGRLILGAIQRHVLGRVDLPEDKLNEFTLYLDEFQNVASESFAAVLSEGRKYRISACLGHQHFSQVPPLVRDSERINIFSQCYFSTSAIDAKDGASEVTSSLSRDEIKRTITSLPVGRMLFVQRGSPTLLVQTPDSKDPEVDSGRLAEYRAAIVARTGIRRCDAERRLLERRAEITGLCGSPEVQHERRPKGKGVRRARD